MNARIEAMHRAKRKKAEQEIWKYVEKRIVSTGCTCELRPGMKRDELPRGSGCKTNFVCPALDTYRRLLPPSPIPEEELALQEADV